ncbi:histone acetyltransferase ESA1 [Hyaloraphidium curvatum]|nr:histone acetyltransferase ESA1 [Hyaloraphidium curvatum]
MGGKTEAQLAEGGKGKAAGPATPSATTRPGHRYTIATLPKPLVAGTILPVLPAGYATHQRAEILSIRFPEPGYEKADYYVHFIGWNKRLDQVVTFDKLRLEEIEWPKEKVQQASGDKSSHKKRSKDRNRNRTGGGNRKSTLAVQAAVNRVAGKADFEAESVPATPTRAGKDVEMADSPSLRVEFADAEEDAFADTQEGEQDGTQQQDEDMEDAASREDDGESVSAGEPEGSVISKQTSAKVAAAAAAGSDTGAGGSQDNQEADRAPLAFNETQTMAEEMERLRQGGSVSLKFQAEAYRMKNINRIVMGEYEVDAWYFSPYPEEYVTLPCIYICQFCLEYFGEKRCFERHRNKCQMLHPPGNEIYYDGNVAFWEIDGKNQRRWCRNLSLLSKLFLDHKTVFYDVDCFWFYAMTKPTPQGHILLGYFSKEKVSQMNYNLACILTLPQHQRKGYGKLLIGFSYLLSRVEGKTGSPEKPLSDLGLLSYLSYWADVILDYLYSFDMHTASVEMISAQTSMTSDDIVHTLKHLGLLKYNDGKYYILLTNQVLSQHEKNVQKKRPSIHPECLDWVPPEKRRASAPLPLGSYGINMMNIIREDDVKGQGLEAAVKRRLPPGIHGDPTAFR